MLVLSKKASMPEDVPLRLDGTQLATEDGCSSGMSNFSNNEAAALNPQGRCRERKTKAAPHQQKPHNCCSLEYQNDESSKVGSCNK